MRVTATRVVNEREIDIMVRKLARSLAPEVVRIRYNLGEDHTGLPSIYLRVLLSDEAAKEPQLFENVRRIDRKIMKTIDPIDRFGLEAYIKFRSVSEQAGLKDPLWE